MITADQALVQNKLREVFVQARLRNPSFSLRAYSSKLGISPAALSEILKGKRRISKKLAERIFSRMNLYPSDRAQILAVFDKHSEKTSKAKTSLKMKTNAKTLELTDDQFRLISDYTHFAILALSETESFISTAESISKRLGISTHQTEDAFKRLERLGLIQFQNDGHFKTRSNDIETPDHLASLALRSAHSQNLELARESLENDPLELRDFTAVTMAIDPELLPEAKKLVRKFRDQLSKLLESGEKKEVYKFCMQLFPLTEIENKDRK